MHFFCRCERDKVDVGVNAIEVERQRPRPTLSDIEGEEDTNQRYNQHEDREGEKVELSPQAFLSRGSYTVITRDGFACEFLQLPVLVKTNSCI